MQFRSWILFVRFNKEKQLFFIGNNKWGSINDAIISDVSEQDSITLLEAFKLIEDYALATKL